jgi:hypothetical protein
MTSRLSNKTCGQGIPRHCLVSVEKCRDGDLFEPVVRDTTAGHFAAKGRTFPCLDQLGGELPRVEIPSNVTRALLAGTHTRGERSAPAVENADELGAYRLTRTTKLKRQVADQAAEQEVAGLMFVSERIEEASDSLLRRPVRIEDWQQPLFDFVPVMFEDRRAKRLFAREVRVERPFRHAGCVGDVFDAACGESSCVDEVEPRCEQVLAHLGIRRPWHAPIVVDRSVIFD